MLAWIGNDILDEAIKCSAGTVWSSFSRRNYAGMSWIGSQEETPPVLVVAHILEETLPVCVGIDIPEEDSSSASVGWGEYSRRSFASMGFG